MIKYSTEKKIISNQVKGKIDGILEFDRINEGTNTSSNVMMKKLEKIKKLETF
ncbi:MAG: hypothetical protein ACW99Q_00010 [Candidatus Kariarchaeaceae archaeon]